MSQKNLANYFKKNNCLPCHDLQVYFLRELLGVITSPFWKEFPKGPILSKTNNKLEHVVRKYVKNREKFNFSTRKILYLDNSMLCYKNLYLTLTRNASIF